MIYEFIKNLKDVVQGKAPLGKKRSPRWTKTRKQFLLTNPGCAVCGGTKKVEVHHIIPFSVNPELELEWTNLITLCESKKGGLTCHLAVGHLGSYQRYNKQVHVDVTYWAERLKESKNEST